MGFSSDGDTRLLKTMRMGAKLPPSAAESRTYKWDWYQAGYSKNNSTLPSYVQDTVHIATKLRTRFLKHDIILPFGNFLATPDHLNYLIIITIVSENNFSKDQHLLTVSYLKAEDKMNFMAAEKMCSSKEIKLLENVGESDATRAYLNIMRLAIVSYTGETCDIKT